MSMTRRTWLGLLASVSVVPALYTPALAQQSQKPNVVFILADNVGYGDLGSYGGGELRGAPTPPPTSNTMMTMIRRVVVSIASSL
jgi:arylsulfatase